MKKYFVGVFAVAFAIIAFSFTESKRVNCPANTDLVWFQVKPTVHISCANYTGIAPADLVQFGIEKKTADPIADALTAGRKLTAVQAATNFGCPQSSDELCFVAYSASLTSADFDIVTDPSTLKQYWLPKSVTAEVCSICRPI
jgi:hypothetical protein